MTIYRTLRRSIAPVTALLLTLALLVGSIPTTRAQSDTRYFPETGHYLGGMFRVFWENNGNVTLFGYPITEEYVASSTGRLTQYFERARFELNEQGTAVELARIGTELTSNRIFARAAPVANTADWRYIPETQHIIQYGFKEIWETRGAERIFGYPISEEMDEQFSDGTMRTVQWFERARFEFWPEYEPGKRVVLTSLGRMQAPSELVAPLAPGTAPGTLPPSSAVKSSGTPTTRTSDTPAPTATPIPATSADAPMPQDFYAHVNPKTGAPGDSFTFDAYGLDPDESVSIWLTAPDNTTRQTDFHAHTNTEGVLSDASLVLKTDITFYDGIWSINIQGSKSGKQSIAYFRISSPPGVSPIGPPVEYREPAPENPLNQPVTTTPAGQTDSSLPPNVNARVTPQVVPPVQNIQFEANGFNRDEPVSIWLTAPDLSTRESGLLGIRSATDGSLLNQPFSISTDLSFEDGVWMVTARGKESGRESVAYFRISRAVNLPAGDPTKLGVMIHQGLPATDQTFIMPLAAPPGSAFTLVAGSYTPGEYVSSWINAVANRQNTPTDVNTSQMDETGMVQIRFMSGSMAEGVYNAVAFGWSSKRLGSASFQITNNYIAGPGTPQPANVNGTATPAQGGLGTVYQIRAQGFQPNEALEFWTTDPYGAYTLLPDRMVADAQGRSGYAPAMDIAATQDFVPGVYGFHFRGTTSGVRADLYVTFSGQP